MITAHLQPSKDGLWLLNHLLESFKSMPVQLIQRPAYLCVQLLKVLACGLCYMTHNAVYHFGLVVLLLCSLQKQLPRCTAGQPH